MIFQEIEKDFVVLCFSSYNVYQKPSHTQENKIALRIRSENKYRFSIIQVNIKLIVNT